MIRSGEEAYDSLVPIMRRYGAEGSPGQFFEAVNRVFHDTEAHVYDDIHRDMWEGLPAIFDLLIEDAGRCSAQFPACIILLDIGCGTGLATEMFRKTAAGSHLAEVCLLDTSAAMLGKAKKRACGWAGVETRTRLGTIFEIPERETYDVVLASSVLHHTPDLPGFFRRLEPLLRPGGLFFHSQDQNAEAEEGGILKEAGKSPCADARLVAGRQWKEADLRSMMKHVLRSAGLFDLVRGMRDSLAAFLLLALGRKGILKRNYLFHVNRALLSEGIISRPMSVEDIWHVTDIHVGQGFGLSTSEMGYFLPNCECISVRTYDFWNGHDSASATRRRKGLVVAGDRHGSLLAGVWQRRQH